MRQNAAVSNLGQNFPPQFGHAAARAFAASDRMNQMVIEHLDPGAWRAKPPGKVRTIAAIFTHVHNVRCKWVRLTAPHIGIPKLMQRSHCTPEQARDGLVQSAAACCVMLVEAREFRRDALSGVWPNGVEMLCYMISHEAHHRGQVCLLAHQFGLPLPGKVASGIWSSENLWRKAATL